MDPYSYALNGTIHESSSAVSYKTSYRASVGVDLSTVTANNKNT